MDADEDYDDNDSQEYDEYRNRRDHWILIDYDTNLLPPPPAVYGIDYLIHINKGEDRTVADVIAAKVNVFCVVKTVAGRHEFRARRVKETWGKRCDKLLFLSTAPDEYLPAVTLSTEEDKLWDREREGFEYIYQYHVDKADWFLMIDDNTYVIMENLKYMLLSHFSSEAVYFGCALEDIQEKRLAFDPGYVLSKTAIEKLAKRSHLCNSTSDLLIVVLGECVRTLDIKAVDSRDSVGRGRLIPFKPPELKMASDGASDYAISFHNVTHSYLNLMEFFVYHLRPFGIVANYTLPESV
ncbi:glycoprotein-N-acetylgalactosamine 3-beta-galactosyltransferase 1 [Amyelois transitella]|uniref:glycoprotein-N-acetylgalactosamine 3-beta-galactosyltransferase 1 n=1 Tax=Amyelois transitella TaxID=680683 RepID=UPI00298FB705|nr:glycoprotein-N-acetylgalactosamine 3-beta-galactosyltransferase 1 [Amyelois transitella]